MERTRKIHKNASDDFKNSNILIVDDEELVRNFLNDALLDADYKVHTANDCEEAKDILSGESFDLIICDINLPGMSGNELLQYCKQTYPDTEIILITGDPGLDRAIEAVKNGAFDYIAKPIALDTLYDRVREVLNHSMTKTSSCMNNTPSIPNKDYKVIRTLGTGSMGIVLLVEKDEKQYAMKILRKDNQDDAFALQIKRFIREAEILHKIDHPNIVKIYEYGISERDGAPFFVMEYVSGKPLDTCILDNSFLPEKKMSIIRQIASALHIVHNKGVIHRDVKPSNIILTEEESVKLTDFGIAGVEDSELTMQSDVLGSPAYMSPEAFNSGKETNEKSDIFSLGIIAYELFTGVNPFKGDTINQIMHQIKTKRPLEPMKLVADIDPGIQDILGKMLAKDPAGRFDNAVEIVDSLDTQTGNNYHKQGFTTRLLRTLILKKPTWQQKYFNS